LSLHPLHSFTLADIAGEVVWIGGYLALGSLFAQSIANRRHHRQRRMDDRRGDHHGNPGLAALHSNETHQCRKPARLLTQWPTSHRMY
jgi:hypothetical protein